MGRIYVGPINITDAGTDASQDVFTLGAGSTNKIAVHEFEIYSDTISAAALNVSLHRRSAAGTGGSAVTEVAIDPDNTVTPTATMTTDTETPGTSTAILMRWWWEQLGPLVYRPAPEDRIVIEVSSYLGLQLNTSPANAALAGYVIWEEL